MFWWIFLVAVGCALYLKWKPSSKPVETVASEDNFVTFSWHEPQGMGEDNLDAPGWHEPQDMVPSVPRPISASLRIDYRDAAGKTSERIVDVRECDTSYPDGYLIGFCRLRQAMRTFRMDRIARVIDMETGEIIPDLLAFAAQKYANSPIASLDSLLDDAADAIRALFYIGKADGRFTAKEKQVMLAYCQAAAGDSRITIAQIESVCRSLDIPSKQAFKLICGRIAKLDEPQRMAILDATEKMIATEKTISGEEAEALAYMKKRLGVMSVEATVV